MDHDLEPVCGILESIRQPAAFLFVVDVLLPFVLSVHTTNWGRNN